MANKDARVNLDILKKFVGELELLVEAANRMADNKDQHDVKDYLTELAKASGLAAAVAGEATLVVGDIKQIIKMNSATVPAGKADDDLLALFNALKGGNTGLPGSN